MIFFLFLHEVHIDTPTPTPNTLFPFLRASRSSHSEELRAIRWVHSGAPLSLRGGPTTGRLASRSCHRPRGPLTRSARACHRGLGTCCTQAPAASWASGASGLRQLEAQGRGTLGPRDLEAPQPALLGGALTAVAAAELLGMLARWPGPVLGARLGSGSRGSTSALHLRTGLHLEPVSLCPARPHESLL